MDGQGEEEEAVLVNETDKKWRPEHIRIRMRRTN